VGGDRTQQHSVQHAENCDRRADAERDRQHQYGSEQRADRQLTDRETKIVTPVGPPLGAAHGILPLFCKCSADLLDVLNIPEAAHRFIARLRWRLTLRAEFLDAHLEMEGELVVHVGGWIWSPEAQIPPPQRRAHDAGCCLALSTRATA